MTIIMYNQLYHIQRSLRKHAYSNILKIFPPKNENFEIRMSDIFHISAQNIDCGYSLEPPQRMSDIFHISAQNIDCGYSLEPPRRGVLTSTHNLCF